METTARSDKPKTLQTIAYVSIPESADLEFLLWDLQDAIAAYAQLSGTALPRPVDLKANDAGAVDGMVIAVDDAFDDEAMTAVEQILDRLGNAKTRVYVIDQAASEDAERAHGTVERLRRHDRLYRQRHCGASSLPAHGTLAATVFGSDGQARRRCAHGLLRQACTATWRRQCRQRRRRRHGLRRASRARADLARRSKTSGRPRSNKNLN